MDAQEFRRLLKRHKEGDERAFEKLYHLCNRRLVGAAFLFLRNKDNAISVADDILIKLYNEPEKYLNIVNPDSWLFVSAKNGALNLLEKAQTRKRHEVELDSERIASINAEPGERLEYYELLNCFPERERTLIVLRVDYGMTYRKIMKHTGMSFNQVFWTIKKIKSRIKRVLEVRK